MSATGSATMSRTSPVSRGSAQAEAALPACSIMRARLSAKRSGILDHILFDRGGLRLIAGSAVAFSSPRSCLSAIAIRSSSRWPFIDILSWDVQAGPIRMPSGRENR